MKVVAISSSPSMDKSNTSVILNPFLDGMREAGADVELLYTRKLKVNPCQGEFNCWVKTPGTCFQKDDMQLVLPKLAEADIWVFATPLYVDGMTGPMKNLVDRTLPLLEPLFELRDGHCRHPARRDTTDRKMVLVSNCGFWELDNFDSLVDHVKAFCRNAGMEFAGALLRPQGPALKAMLEMGAPVNDILEASREAGSQLVNDGEMSTATLGIVSRELLPLEMYVQIANDGFQRQLDELATKQRV